MKIIKRFGWTYYLADKIQLDRDKVGKWMYFFNDKKYVVKVCKNAVKMNIVKESKHSDDKTGVACFYLNYDDNYSHKKVIEFFLQNNLIKRTKSGRLYNISFKLDSQTNAGEYGDQPNLI